MKIIGHRGARGLAPENTIAGIKKALQHHVDMIEFDVRVTSDGVPILHHSGTVTGHDGTKLRIAKHTYQELLKHKTDLATLDEVFSLKERRPVDLYIEVKRGQPIKPIVDSIKAYLAQSGRSDDLFLASKSQKTLRELHRSLPEVEKIVIEVWSGLKAVYRARQVNASIISMNQMWLWSGVIKALSSSGRELYTYTVNKPAKARRWAKYGLAGIVTDYPDRFEH